MNKISKALGEIFTNSAGQHDVGRYSWFICTLAMICSAVLNFVHKQEIDLMAFGTGLSGIAVAHGAALGLKNKTEG